MAARVRDDQTRVISHWTSGFLFLANVYIYWSGLIFEIIFAWSLNCWVNLSLTS